MSKESKAIGRKAAGSYGPPKNANKKRGYNAKRAGNKAIRKAGKNYEIK